MSPEDRQDCREGVAWPRGRKTNRSARPARPKKPACLENKWQFGPDVPTYDFFEHRNLDDPGDREEVLEDLIRPGTGEFLLWEAVVCQELGLPLTKQQARRSAIC